MLLIPPRPLTEVQDGKSENCHAISETSKTHRGQRRTSLPGTEENNEKSQS